jgi:NADPH2:quinone reductase
MYASMTEPKPVLPFYAFMRRNVLLRFVFLYEVPVEGLARAAQDINTCLEQRSLRHLIAERFRLERTAAAHIAVESGSLIGNAVITIDS